MKDCKLNLLCVTRRPELRMYPISFNDPNPVVVSYTEMKAVVESHLLFADTLVKRNVIKDSHR